jgi:hypothetical protein
MVVKWLENGFKNPPFWHKRTRLEAAVFLSSSSLLSIDIKIQ